MTGPARRPELGDVVTVVADWDGPNRIVARIEAVELQPSVVLTGPGRDLNGRWHAMWTPAEPGLSCPGGRHWLYCTGFTDTGCDCGSGEATP